MIRFSSSKSLSRATLMRASSRGYPHDSQRLLQTVAVQLDYYMSPQFAGVASALTNNLYEKNGLKPEFLPICPVGQELQRVRDYANLNKSIPTIGSVEQNIFIPLLYKDPNLKLKAIAAMFRRSPLCLASLSDSSNNTSLSVGAHEDTVSLLERILADQNGSKVHASPRATKIQDLKSGEYNAIQAYLTTEVPTLVRQMGEDVVDAVPLEGLNGAKLGYSQMLFSTEEGLVDHDQREIIQTFLDATFEGWRLAIQDHESAAKSVDEARKILGLDDENNDHWDTSSSYMIESVGLCCDFAKETFLGDRYGVINPERFHEATDWLLKSQGGNGPQGDSFGVDTKIWQPPSQLLAGNELAHKSLETAKTSAQNFALAHGRKPSVAVITVGDLPRYKHGARRIDLYSNDQNSWFNKTMCGEANGFDVTEVSLPERTTTEELLSQLYAVRDLDGVQLMWPLPDHIDAAKAYNAICATRDVDGAHYIGQAELSPNSTPFPPVTPAAVLDLADEHNVELQNRNVLVVGRSRIVGSPIAHMLRERGAIVTTAHSAVPSSKLEELVKTADLVIACAGSPGLLQSSWLKPGAEVINVGTTFAEDKGCLVSDFEGDLSSVAARYSPVPGGIGPLSVGRLFRNVADAAWRRSVSTSDIESAWTRQSGSLVRTIHFKNYDDALSFANSVNDWSTEMDHHANMSFSHECVDGVDVNLEFFTFEANEVTSKDYEAARAVNHILESEPISMDDFSYSLKSESIAKYPPNPRGSSRLVQVDSKGQVSHFENFSDAFPSLAEGAHIVFNESKVANARLGVVGTNGGGSIELMILDLGDVVSEKCAGSRLNVMLRKEGVSVGEIFTDDNRKDLKFEVVEVIAPWIEDEESNGNGTECIVKCIVADPGATLAEVLQSVGSVPIPPYLNRDAEQADETTYNNVYANGVGSVAAPTAGLHFTDELLKMVGEENMSFLSLHVGAGTFQPVVADNALNHKMHGESFNVPVREIHRLVEVLESKKRMIVVGTTSSRTLESLYWCGVKKILGVDSSEHLSLGQNEWNGLKAASQSISPEAALKALTEGKTDTDIVKGRTSLMIVPNDLYEFKVVDELVTNFHAPDSTLMLLVSAFLGSGKAVKQVYEEAQEAGFRFLSYGDACLFAKRKK